MRSAPGMPSVRWLAAARMASRSNPPTKTRGGRPYLPKPVERGRLQFPLLDVVPTRRQFERSTLHLSNQVAYGRIHVTDLPVETNYPPGQVRIDGGPHVVCRQRR